VAISHRSLHTPRSQVSGCDLRRCALSNRSVDVFQRRTHTHTHTHIHTLHAHAVRASTPTGQSAAAPASKAAPVSLPTHARNARMIPTERKSKNAAVLRCLVHVLREALDLGCLACAASRCDALWRGREVLDAGESSPGEGFLYARSTELRTAPRAWPWSWSASCYLDLLVLVLQLQRSLEPLPPSSLSRPARSSFVYTPASVESCAGPSRASHDRGLLLACLA